MNYAILGFGGRGSVYASLFKSVGGVNLSAVCEIRPDRLEKAGRLYGLTNGKLFLSDKEFFSKGRLGELCVIATQDEQHKEHALMALEAGYDLLLEKPIATTMKDCRAVYEKAKKIGRKIFICHVLRYAPFFSLIKKELNTGEYGKIATVNLTENIAYWHFAHSYVRGNWSAVPPSAPMIIAKTCHDLDIICWLAKSECKAVSSHPFMEGNGRSTRIWLDMIFKKNFKRCIDWSKIGKMDYHNAMKESVKDPAKIKALLKTALTEKINDREVFMKGIDYSYYYEEETDIT